MPPSLAGQSIVVVGASSGIGRATALLLAEQGARVIAAARRLTRLQDLALQQKRIQPVAVDVTQPADVQRLVDTAGDRIDALVYATGTNTPDRALGALTPTRWQELLDTNLSGALHCTQAVLPAMRQHGGGLIIYIASAAVQRPDVSGVAYQASKHGLVGLAGGVRVEERDRGIRTTVIYPGLCDTEILSKRPTPTPAETLQQALSPADVAAAVVFVASLPPRALVPELQIVPAGLW